MHPFLQQGQVSITLLDLPLFQPDFLTSREKGFFLSNANFFLCISDKIFSSLLRFKSISYLFPFYILFIFHPVVWVV